MNNENFEWQVGDIGEAFGVRCEVLEIKRNAEYPVIVRILEGVETGLTLLFTKDYAWHKKPSLIFIERPKKKVKKTIEVKVWANIYESGGKSLFYQKEDADKYASDGRIACFELTGSYEIEVEE